MKKLVLAVAMVAALGATSYALEVGKTEFGTIVGYAMPMGDFGDAAKASLGAGLFGGYQFHENFSAGLEAVYNFKFGPKEDLPAGWDYSVKVMQITPYIKAGKSFDKNGKKGSYYAIAGAGMYSSKVEMTTPAIDLGVIVIPAETVSESESDFGFNFGGGVQFEVAPQWNLGLDVRYHIISTEGTSTSYFTPGLTIAYTF